MQPKEGDGAFELRKKLKKALKELSHLRTDHRSLRQDFEKLSEEHTKAKAILKTIEETEKEKLWAVRSERLMYKLQARRALDLITFITTQQFCKTYRVKKLLLKNCEKLDRILTDIPKDQLGTSLSFLSLPSANDRKKGTFRYKNTRYSTDEVLSIINGKVDVVELVLQDLLKKINFWRTSCDSFFERTAELTSTIKSLSEQVEDANMYKSMFEDLTKKMKRATTKAQQPHARGSIVNAMVPYKHTRHESRLAPIRPVKPHTAHTMPVGRQKKYKQAMQMPTAVEVAKILDSIRMNHYMDDPYHSNRALMPDFSSGAGGSAHRSWQIKSDSKSFKDGHDELLPPAKLRPTADFSEHDDNLQPKPKPKQQPKGPSLSQFPSARMSTFYDDFVTAGSDMDLHSDLATMTIKTART